MTAYEGKGEYKKDEPRLPLIYAFIALGPILAFVIGDQLIETFGFPNSDSGMRLDQNVIPAAMWPIRYRFLAAFIFFFFVSAASVAFFAFDIRGRLTHEILKTLRLLVILLILTVVIFISLGPILLHSPQSEWYFGTELFERALSAPLRSPRTPGMTFFDVFRGLLRTSHAVLALAISAIGAGALSCLAAPVPETLQKRKERFMHYLYLAAAVMIAGLFFNYSWPSLPKPMIAREHQEIFEDCVRSFVLYNGVIYSAVIAALFFPILVLLCTSGEASGAEGEDEGAGSIYSPLDLLKQIFALLSPAILGLLPTLLGGV